MARNEMLKIKQIEGLSEILTGTAVSGPSDEIIIGAGLSEPLTSSINFRYNITDGLFVGSGGLRVADFGGSGSQMVVVDNTGVFSVQDIPTEATLTSTYIGFGSPTGFLTGSADLTWSGSTFKIGSASPAYTGNLNVIGAAGSASAISIGVQNTSSDGWSHLMLNQDSANYGYIGKYGTTYGSAHPGTSISYNNNLVVASSSLSADGTAPLSMIGSILYGITGVTSSNFGYRLDTTGLRVGRLSTLHTANTYPFEVGIDGTYKTIFTGTSLAFTGGYTSSIVNRSTDSSFGNPLGNGAFEISSGSTAGFVLGTISNTPLVFATNNIERLRVEATGNAVLSGTAAVHRQYRINIPEDIGTAGGLLIWSSGNNETYLRRSYDSGNLDGTSIPYYHNTILSSKKSGAQFNGEITIGGNTIYNVVGTTSSNYGTRLDSVGLKIGILSSLHTAGVAPFQIGTGLYASAAMMSIGAVLSGGYNGSYGIYNSRANAAGVLNRHFVGESAANSVGTIAAFELRNYNDVTSRFVNYANAGTSLLSGTSINLASSLRIDNTIGTYSNSLSSSGKILLTGSEIYAISGSTATNYGTRLDSVGFRIGQISTLHTANTVLFQADGITINPSGGSYILNSTLGLDLVTAANDLTFNAAGSIFNFRPTRFGSAVNPTARIDIQENTSSLASLRLRRSSNVAVSSPNTGDIWNDGSYINFGGGEGLSIGNGNALASTYGISVNSGAATGIYVLQSSSSSSPVTSFFKAINAGGTMEIVSRFNRGDGTTVTPAAGTGGAISFGIPDGVSVYQNVDDAVVIGGIYDQVATTSSSSRNTAFKVRTMSAGVLQDRMQVGDLGTQINSLSGTGDRMVETDEDGFITAATEIVDGWISDAGVIALITDEDNWSILGVYTGTALTGTYQGQEHFDDKYYYKFVSDNNPIRMARV